MNNLLRFALLFCLLSAVTLFPTGVRAGNGIDLHYAAKAGDVSLLRQALKKGAAVDRLDRKERTPLMFAARWGQIRAMQFLLAAGANPDAASTDGYTPLMYATYGGFIDAVRVLLLEANANWRPENNKGQTALAIARSRGNYTVRVYLAREFLGPMLWQSLRGEDLEEFDFLLEYGADATTPGPNKENLLEVCLTRRNTQALASL